MEIFWVRGREGLYRTWSYHTKKNLPSFFSFLGNQTLQTDGKGNMDELNSFIS